MPRSMIESLVMKEKGAHCLLLAMYLLKYAFLIFVPSPNAFYWKGQAKGSPYMSVLYCQLVELKTHSPPGLPNMNNIAC